MLHAILHCVIFTWCIGLCRADMSLYLPGFDPQPISVNIEGVGADGETTYEVVAGQPTGTWIGQPAPFIGTGFLVEGAGNAVFSYANADLSITFIESCTIANGLADCNDIQPDVTTVFVEETAIPMLVQGGTAVPAATGVASGSGIPETTAAAPGGSFPSGSTPTGTQTSATPPESTPSTGSGVRLRPSVAGSVGMLAIFWAIINF
ncbi:hypothetical protein BU15DRAFT_60605 [Melanogaster broomeanus]|nr:hypothetical protein BU15DRAFT_60605 [Melanogaster broomeanus]